MTTTEGLNVFEGILEEMKTHEMKIPGGSRTIISIPDSKNVLKNALDYFIGLEGKKAQWLPEYDEVAAWLSNNNGKGLFLYGNCGRGKSIICRYAIPAILLKYMRKVVNVFDTTDLQSDVDKILSKCIVTLDDIGTESMSVVYGQKRFAFPEVIDASEKNGKLVIVSTNLDKTEIEKRYGTRVMDRIIATTVRVAFNGESLRK